MDEFTLINKYFRPLTNPKNSQNLDDDVALIGNDLVVSKDIIVQDVHFTLKDTAYNIANRLIRSNLSDIAASGTKPLYYMLGFCKNHHVNENFLHSFSKALKEINEEFNISLIGGDTVKSKDKLFFSITIFGQKEKEILSRKNAANKDLIFVSGTIGDAMLGRKITEGKITANKEDKQYLINRYYKAEPRIKLGRELLKNNLSKSAIDVSDGLLADIKQIGKSSNLQATIFQNKIPLSKAAKNILKNKELSILDLSTAGDDYELIFTTKAIYLKEIARLSKKLKIPLTNIGYFQQTLDKKLINLIDGNNEIEINKFGYEH